MSETSTIIFDFTDHFRINVSFWYQIFCVEGMCIVLYFFKKILLYGCHTFFLVTYFNFI